MASKIKVLDCTFRDGGYYNNWDFDIDLANKYFAAIEKSKIDVIEIGFRYTPKDKQLGPFAYCKEDFLRTLNLPSCSKAVMINAKDFITYEGGAKKCVNDLFVPKEDSVIDIVRICAYLDQIEQCEPICKELKQLGYMPTFNIMQISGKDSTYIADAVKMISSWESVDVLYMADSFGSMDEEELDRICAILRDNWDKDLGIHAHNNKGRALDNTIYAASELGVEWLDGTMLGMGRGSGNANTESFLIELNNGWGLKYQTDEIFGLVMGDFEELKKKYGWGTSLLYYIAAMNDIHPTYIQEIMSSVSYNNSQRVKCVNNLSKSENSNKYNGDILSVAMMDGFSNKKENYDMDIKIVIPARYKSSRFPGKSLVDLNGKSLIQRVWERCCLALPKENVFVATEDEVIKNHCEERGIQVIMTTDKCMTGTDRVYEASLNLNADLIVNVQGDEPLISPDDITNVIEKHIASPEKVHCGMCQIFKEEDFRNPSIIKVVTKENNEMILMSRAPIPTTKKSEFKKAMKQVCIYAFPKKALIDFGNSKQKTVLESIEDIEILRFIELGYDIEMVEVSDSSIAVDYPEDVDRVIRAIKEYDNIHG